MRNGGGETADERRRARKGTKNNKREERKSFRNEGKGGRMKYWEDAAERGGRVSSRKGKKQREMGEKRNKHSRERG